jgi:hypothetical protein
MKYFLLLLPLVSVGCSSFRAPEKPVVFPYVGKLVEESQTLVGRAPAQAQPLEAKEDKSNRRVYFSALYHQYLTLSAHAAPQAELSFCPQFHHDKLETEAFTVPKVLLMQSAHVQEEGKAFFPELALEDREALGRFTAAVRQELEVLCEDGVSDNYFKFDNLVTHYSGKRAFHFSARAMESVLKIPVFANYYLIKMVTAQSGFDFTHPDERRFIQLSQTHWFERYVSEARGQRQKFIKNQLVRR